MTYAIPKKIMSSIIRLMSSNWKFVDSSLALFEKHPQCTSIPLNTACDKSNMKKTSIEIVMLIVPSKNKPKIRKIPIINSAQGSTKATMFSMMKIF